MREELELKQRVERLEVAVKWLADWLENGEWHGVRKEIEDLLNPLSPLKDK